MGDTFWMIVTSCILCAWVVTAGICLERAVKRSTALVRARMRIEELEQQLAASQEELEAHARAQAENKRLRTDGDNAARMIVMMAAEIASSRQETRKTGPKVGMGAAPVSTDIIVEFHKRAEDALAAGEG